MIISRMASSDYTAIGIVHSNHGFNPDSEIAANGKLLLGGFSPKKETSPIPT